VLLLLAACQAGNKPDNASFTLAVIPDTQNYIDFRHQKEEGFELDSSELFIQQMQYIADHSFAKGGDIAFVASVGDVWLRLMRFDLRSNPARITVKTYSSYYTRYSSEVDEYASWYKAHEQPDMNDDEFHATDDYVINIDGFQQRFSSAFSAGRE